MISMEWRKFFAFSLSSGFLLHRSKANLFTDGTSESVGVRTSFCWGLSTLQGQVCLEETVHFWQLCFPGNINVLESTAWEGAREENSWKPCYKRLESMSWIKKEKLQGLLFYFRWRNLGQSQVWTRASLLSGHHCPVVDRIGSRGWSRSLEGQVQAVSIPSKSFLSPHSRKWRLRPRGQQCWAGGSEAGAQSRLGRVLGPSLQISQSLRSLSETASSSTSDGHLCPVLRRCRS